MLLSDVATLSRELRTIRASFRQLSASFLRIAPALVKQATDASTSDNGSGRRKPRLTASHRAGLKLQGRYMGRLKPRQRARVKKVRAAKGVRAAIAVARRISGVRS